MKVTCIVWFAEFVGSILLIFIPKVFGHTQAGTSIGYGFMVDLYFVLLPFLYLINDSDVKNSIADDSLFRGIRGIFNRPKAQVLPK